MRYLASVCHSETCSRIISLPSFLIAMGRTVVMDSFRINFIILKLFALYPADLCSRTTFKWYGYLHELFFTMGFPFLGVLQLLTDRSMDMFEVVDSLFVLSQLSVFPLKHVPFLLKYERLDKLYFANNLKKCHLESVDEGIIYHVKKLELKSFIDVLPNQRRFIENSTETCRFIFKLLCGLCTGCCVFYTLRPVYLNISIPTKIWWPIEVDTRNSISRYLAWFYCAYSGCHGVFSTSAIDTLISGLVIHATGQIKILKNNLQFLGEKTENSVSSLSESRRSIMKRSIIKYELLKCANHYNDIIEFMNDLEDLLSMAVFCQIVGSTVVICMMCYMLTLVEPFSVTGVSFSVYVASMLFQIFFYCFFGNDLIAESNTISEAIYMGDWYTYDIPSRRILILIMERAKKPLVQTAGHVMVLSLELFVMVLKQAYSLMAVLQSQSN